MAIIIKNLKKSFGKQLVFEGISVTFPNSGFISILGKSGCGKSTFLHCLGGLCGFDDGEIVIDYAKSNKKRKKIDKKITDEHFSYVFQHYQLLESETIIFNVSLPLLIRGYKKKESLLKAEELLVRFGIDKNRHKDLVKVCSGGEKQRIALARSLIVNPSIVLADEPTGALDSNNSDKVLTILKEYSKEHLVIMVTHNIGLANEFSNRILEFRKNRLITVKDDIDVDKFDKRRYISKRSSNWIETIINQNLKKRLIRNSISSLSLTISLIFSFLLIGFLTGSKKEIDIQSVRQFDSGVSLISEQTVTDISDTKFNLVEERRINEDNIETFVANNDIFTYGYNYDYLIPPNIDIKCNDISLVTCAYQPIYSFLDESCPNLLFEGRLAKDTLYETVINKQAFDYMIEKGIKNPLKTTLKLTYIKEIITYVDSQKSPYIIDFLNYDIDVKIVGVVKETEFLNSPKIYYSYLALDSYLETYYMNNLSAYYNENYSFKDRVIFSSSKDEVTSYSHRLFLKSNSMFERFQSSNYEPYVVQNNSLMVKEAVHSFVEASGMGMELFLLISLIGSVFILGIISYSTYSQDRHQNAILLTLGASNSDVFIIYVIESILIGLLAFLVSLGISIGICPFINSILTDLTGFTSLVQIPIRYFLNRRYFLLIIFFFASLFISLITTCVSIGFSKKIDLSLELKEE